MSRQPPPFDPSIPDEDRGHELFVTVTVLSVFVVLSTVARVGIKLFQRLRLWWDDYWILLGMALNMIGNAFEYLGLEQGLGRHTQYLSRSQQRQVSQWAQFCTILPFFAIWAVKISICFFLLSMIRGTHARFKWFIYGLMILATITTFLGGLLWGLQATPIEFLWDRTIPGGTRRSPESFAVSAYIQLSLACFTDLLYSISPIYFLWGIQMKWRHKLPILCLTGCGILVVIVGLLTISFVPRLLDIFDASFALVDLFITNLVNRNFANVVANLPALWLLVREMIRTYRNHTNRSWPRRTYDSKMASATSDKGRDPNWIKLQGSGQHREPFGGDDGLRGTAGNNVEIEAHPKGTSSYIGEEEEDGFLLRDRPYRSIRAAVNEASAIQIDTEVQVTESSRHDPKIH